MSCKVLALDPFVTLIHLQYEAYLRLADLESNNIKVLLVEALHDFSRRIIEGGFKLALAY